MKRLHVHMAVDDLDRAIAFYATLFGVPPTVRRPDYVKWMLDDPPVNFAVSQRDDHKVGIDHLGIQVETDNELREISSRLKSAASARAIRRPRPAVTRNRTRLG
jgi:catechol 2,3-dioxygenase-like lactoylglutathione lyase family enzyme